MTPEIILGLLAWTLLTIGYFTAIVWVAPKRAREEWVNWVRSPASDEVLIEALEGYTNHLRSCQLVDFEEHILPAARKSLQDWFNGAMGNAARHLQKDSKEGAGLSIMASMAEELKDQPWYVQAAATKILPLIENAVQKPGNADSKPQGLGLIRK